MYPYPGAQPHQRQPSYSSGPPHKKPRGNPIITRYPPPPGYRPPSQAAWQQQPQYAATSAQPPLSLAPQYSGPVYPHAAQLAQQSTYESFLSAGAYQASPTYSTTQVVPLHPGMATSWQPHATDILQNGVHPHSVTPNPALRSAPPDQDVGPMDLHLPSGSAEDLEEDFDAECYYASHPEEINPELSLGIIEWKAPLLTKRALASTFAEAELDAFAPLAPRLNDDESVSDFFKWPRREEAFLSVRQTEGWDAVKDSLIYREFAVVCDKIISMAELLANYRYQFNAEWAQGESTSTTPELSRVPTPVSGRQESIGRHSSHGSRANSVPLETPGQYVTQTNPLDELENALNSYNCRGSTHSRKGSTVSQQSTTLTRPKPLPAVRDPQQEDILAALGVTGSPKTVYQTPGPAFGPPPSAKLEQNHHSRSSSVNSNSGGLDKTSFRRESSSTHQFYREQTNGQRHDRPLSSNSYLSAEAAAFDPEPDNDITPKPIRRWDHSGESRKRSFADTLAGGAVETIQEEDEETPRQKKVLRVDDSRW